MKDNIFSFGEYITIYKPGINCQNKYIYIYIYIQFYHLKYDKATY